MSMMFCFVNDDAAVYYCMSYTCITQIRTTQSSCMTALLCSMLNTIMPYKQLFSAITDAWTVIIVVYSVLRDDGKHSSVLVGEHSDSAITQAVVMHTTLFLTVLTTQVNT